jgi:lipopolysaccharide/colanic/teichoic acid biosynthesis glycosyltransferase
MDSTLKPLGVRNVREFGRNPTKFALMAGSRSMRVTDVVVSLLALFFLLPLLLITALCVFVTDPGPIFFAHRRIGRGGSYFHCLKFRTMMVNAAELLDKLLAEDPVAKASWDRDHKLKDDPRVTPIGRFLRSSSLDELPQFWNVLRGDMSLVGPRPIVDGEVVRYGRYFEDYCRVRPGITGLWQVSGRNDVTYRRRVALDVVYARSQSIRLNMKIMAMTVPCVIQAKGSY